MLPTKHSARGSLELDTHTLASNGLVVDQTPVTSSTIALLSARCLLSLLSPLVALLRALLSGALAIALSTLQSRSGDFLTSALFGLQLRDPPFR